MAQAEFPFLLRYRVHSSPEIGIALIDNGVGRVLTYLFSVNHHVSCGKQSHNHPHGQTEAGAGQYRDSRYALGYRH